MKFNVLAAVVAAAALAEAAPLRVLMISSGPLPPPPMIDRARFGHAVPQAADAPRPAMFMGGPHHNHEHPNARPTSMRRPCGGRMGAMKAKALQLSNAFRQALGLPLIDSEPPHMVHVGPMQHGKILPPTGTPTFIDYKLVDGKMQGKTRGGEKIEILPVQNLPHPHVQHSKVVSYPEDFLYRLQNSLMNLGVWEAAAVSFVLGCGIGVLLRMIYVFTVLVVRSFKGRNTDEVQYSRVVVIEDYEDAEQQITSPPPTYAYPIDEKHAEEANAKIAPASN